MRLLHEYSEVFEDFGWEADEFIDAGDAVVVPGASSREVGGVASKRPRGV